jgi:hypothetical protein
MKVRENVILFEAIKSGVIFGWNRAFKHTDEPSTQLIKENIIDNVLTYVSEYYNFNNDHINEYVVFRDAVEEGTNINSKILMDDDTIKETIVNNIFQSIKQKFIIEES